MSKRNSEEDPLFELLRNKKRMEPSDEAKEKSLQAFQDGLQADRPQQRKKRKFRKRVIGFTSTFAVIGIAIVLAASQGTFDEQSSDSEDIPSQGSNDNVAGEQDTEEVTYEESRYHIDGLAENIWERTPIDYEISNDFQSVSIFNNHLGISIPHAWKVNEIDGEDMYSIKLTKSSGDEINLVLFHKDNQELFDSHLQELTDRFSSAEPVIIHPQKFVDRIKSTQQISFVYEDVFPFDIDQAEMTTFIDESNDKLMDLYTSELFGYQMIFTSELSLSDVEIWDEPIHLLATMRVNDSLVIHGSESEPHPDVNRPMAKTILLPLGAISVDTVEMKLYINEELQVSSYVAKDAEVERIEHEHFTEWRFTEPHILDTTFYAFGKLKSSFPLENGKEVMFEAFDIDLAYSDMHEGVNPYHYSYDSANAQAGIGVGGYFELFEVDGEWYYIHKHADWNNYNGGYYTSRLKYFQDSLKWQ